MKKYLILFCSLFLFCNFLFSKNEVNVYENNEDTLSLIFAGDIMGHSPQFKAAYNPKTKLFNYDICFQNVRKYIESTDIAIVNLEVPLAGKPFSGYPNFSSPDALLDGLKTAGYDIILTANNHALDCGKKGLERTINVIKNRNLLFAGSYIDKTQRDSIYPLVIEKKGVKIAFLNCTYGTNAYKPLLPNIVNYLDSIQIKNDILKVKAKGVDFIVMTVHWGTEYELQSNDFQKKYANFFTRNGINLIIGGHPHVVQNADYLIGNDSNKVPVFYSLGNSISNQRQPNTDGGIMVKVQIGTKSKHIIKTSFLPVYVYKGVLNKVFQYHLIPTTDYLKKSIKYPINQSDKNSLLYFDKLTKFRLSNFDVFE